MGAARAATSTAGTTAAPATSSDGPAVSSRNLLLALLLLVPAAAAHGEPPAYDPLLVSVHAHLAGEGLAEPAPEPGAVAFRAKGPTEESRLAFSMPVPVRFVLAGPVQVELTLRADKPVVAHDASGHTLEVRLERNGRLVEGASARVGTQDALLAPGALARLSVALQAPQEVWEEGDTLALALHVLPAGLAEGALSVVVGGDAPSRMDMARMRVPSVQDLGIQERPLPEFVVGAEGAGMPSNASVRWIDVRHDRIAAGPWSGAARPAYVALRGVEEGAEAQGHAFPDRERRVEAAHEFSLHGVVARVHDGLGVAVPVPAEGPVTLRCVRHCPPGGFTLEVAGANDTRAGEPPSVLIPPPRDTRGIPVSADEPPARETPLPALLALAALMLAASKR